MPSSISKPAKHRRSTLKNSGVTNPAASAAILITNLSVSGSVLTLEFNQSVILGGVPQFICGGIAATPVSAEQTSPTTVDVTYDASVAAATYVNIPYQDPAIRTARGGFVTATAVVMV